MSVAACAALVERGDPDRFRAAMVAPVAARPVLFGLYAFNVEVSRAPWVTQEPMIAEMRLQWWRDALDEIATGGPVRRHEVVDVLADVLSPDAARALDALVAARRWDIYTDPFEDAAHLRDYLTATTAALMTVAAQTLGPADADVVADAGYAFGVASLLRAVPALEARGRKPLVDGRPDAVRALAQGALDRLDAARRRRRAVSKRAGAALVSGWRARPVLRAAIADPMRVADGALDASPLQTQLRFTAVSLRGWWT